MRTLLILTAILVVIAVSTTEGADLMKGPGCSTCATFMERISQDASWEGIYYYWTLGYISALNSVMFLQKGQFRNIDAFPSDENMSTLRSYCANHRGDMYLQAVDNLIGKLPTLHK